MQTVLKPYSFEAYEDPPGCCLIVALNRSNSPTMMVLCSTSCAFPALSFVCKEVDTQSCARIWALGLWTPLGYVPFVEGKGT